MPSWLDVEWLFASISSHVIGLAAILADR